MSSSPCTRRAQADDYSVFTRLFPELGIDDPLPDQERFRTSIMADALIAEIDGRPVGYGMCRALADVGHVGHVIVDPAHRRKGVGQALMSEMAERFRGQGLSRWCLNVKPSNEPALSLYRGLGMKDKYESVVIRFPWSMVDDWPESGGELSTAVPVPDDDSNIESSLAITAGMLASRRKNPDYVLLGIREANRWVGCAAFSPSHPGAFPFKVARPELSAPFLRELRNHAVQPDMQIVAEADPALADYLIGRGAQDHMRILHLEGPLDGAPI